MLKTAGVMALVLGALPGPAAAGDDDSAPRAMIPFQAEAPVPDGVAAPGEWDGAARITGFGNYNQGALVPEKLQPSWRLSFDEENLYLVSDWPLYPAGSIKARNKRGDEGGSHPGATGWPDGLLGDDHVEIQISTWPDPNMALTRHFFKWMVNPYGAMVDQKREHAVGWAGFEWESGARTGCRIEDSVWTLEMAIPWASIGFAAAPEDGTALTLQLVNASDSEMAYLGWVPTGWLDFKGFATVVVDRRAPAVQVESLGELMDGRLALAGAVVNPGPEARKLDVEFVVDHPDKGEVFHDRLALDVPAGGRVPLALAQTLALEQPDSVLWGQGQRLRGKPAYRYQLTVTDEGKQTVFRQGGRFFKRPADLETALFEFLASSRGVSGDPAVNTAYLPSYDKCEVSVDVDILGIKPELRAAHGVDVVVEKLVEDHRQPVVAGTTYRYARHVEPIPDSGRVEFVMDVPPLPPGAYGVFTRLLDEKGGVLFTKRDMFKRHRFEWENNTLGKGDQVIPPWTPIAVSQRKLGVWGRETTFGSDGLPASIKSLGDELLAGPVRLEADLAGQPAAWTTAEPFHVTRAGPGVVETEANGRLGTLPVTIATRTEYDGFMQVTLALQPSEKTDVRGMRLVIPLAEPVDTVLVIGGSGRLPDFAGELPRGEGVLWRTSEGLPHVAGIRGKYIATAYFGNGERGLTYTCWSDEGWVLDDGKDTADIRRVEGVVCLVLHLANTAREIEAPRRLTFALQATPVRPMTPGYRRGPALARAHLRPERPRDTAAVTTGFLSCYGGKPGTDHLTIYDETDWAIMREQVLRYRRADWPKYGRTLLNYTASNTLGLGMREYDTYAGEWAFSTELKPNPTVARGFYNDFGVFGPRQQTRVRCDLVPSAVDMRVWAFDQMQRKAGLNGYWWDHEAYWSSASLVRGTAYVRDDGTAQGTLNIPLFRELFKRLATVSHRNAMVNIQGRYAHSGNVPAINGYCSYLWAIEGPWYMPNLAFDQFETIGGLARYRAYVGRWLGVPVTHRSFVQDREFKIDQGERPFQSRSVIGLALLHDVGVDSMQLHRELCRRTAKALDSFDLFDDQRTEWIPYWRSGALAKPDMADAVATVYVNRPKKGPVEALVVVFNSNKEPVQTVLQLDGTELLGQPILTCRDLETGEPVAVTAKEHGATVSIEIEGHDYRLVWVR